MSEPTEPSRDQLLAMAYVDGELSDEARAELERRMTAEPALAREVAELRKLAVLARHAAPPEPMDNEWERLEAELLHAGGSRLGLLLSALGVFAGSGYVVYRLVLAEISILLKAPLLLLVAGVLLLFLLTLRARLRTLPYDPYTDVKR